MAALRVSGRSEGVEEGPVGFAGVEQGPDSVVGEVGESEGAAFDAFDQVVGCLGGCVGDSGGVPVGDLVSPVPDGAAQPIDLWPEFGGCFVFWRSAGARRSGVSTTSVVGVLVGAEYSDVGVDLQRCQLILIPRVLNLVSSVPAQQRFRRDEPAGSPPSGQGRRDRTEQGPVLLREGWSAVLAVEDGELVAQHDDLEVLRGTREHSQACQRHQQPW